MISAELKTKLKNKTMEKQKTIYELDLHESVMVKVNITDGRGYPCEWQVTRVASGWLYQDSNPRRTTVSEFFVPFDNSFQIVPK